MRFGVGWAETLIKAENRPESGDLSLEWWVRDQKVLGFLEFLLLSCQWKWSCAGAGLEGLLLLVSIGTTLTRVNRSASRDELTTVARAGYAPAFWFLRVLRRVQTE